MDAILSRLTALGLSQPEARVYCALVEYGKQTGYQVARAIGAARSSVYPALDSLCKRGMATLIPGETNSYTAVDPETAMGTLTRDFQEQAHAVVNDLSSLKKKGTTEPYLNIEGKTNILNWARNMIAKAEREILLSSTMDLLPLSEALASAAARKVRIILFSWVPLELYGIPIEFHCAHAGQDVCPEDRLMMVTDAQHAMIASNDRSTLFVHKEISPDEKLPTGENDYLGMASDNRLMINIINEHIHFDIYLHRLRKKHGIEIIDSSIQIGTLMETGL